MAWVTQFRRKLGSDTFFRARLRMTVYFVTFCVIMFFTGSMIIDFITHAIMLKAFANPSAFPPEVAISRIDHIRWGIRLFYILGFSLGAYYLMGFALRPVRDAVESERRFIANISHELRTPLTLAKTETELLLRKPDRLDLPRAVEGLKRNLEEINHVSRIIQFLLVLSDFSEHKADAIQQKVSLMEVITHVKKQVTRLLEEKGVILSVVLAMPDAVIRGNPVALEKMLLNLVRNAITYSASGGTVTVELKESDKGAVVAVHDEGVGMSSHDSAHVFEPFYRGASAVPGGTGLGLAIVREVVRLHNATIELKSTEGSGSSFHIAFPHS